MIAGNAGVDGAVVVSAALGKDGGHGYNAETANRRSAAGHRIPQKWSEWLFKTLDRADRRRAIVTELPEPKQSLAPCLGL
jgi:hypothetical protein